MKIASMRQRASRHGKNMGGSWPNGWAVDVLNNYTYLTAYRNVYYNIWGKGQAVTHHEALVILESAEINHRKPPAKGGHGHPLTLQCFMGALKLNARACGYSPADFLNQWKAVLPGLLRNGYVHLDAQAHCGISFLSLTKAGRITLDRWNTEGCESHRATREVKPCSAPEIRDKVAA
jgi:hypothetical protein